jgi:hypothetical protein
MKNLGIFFIYEYGRGIGRAHIQLFMVGAE